MKSTSIAEAKNRLPALIRESQESQSPIIIRRHDTSVAALIPFATEDDYQDWLMEQDPRFPALLEHWHREAEKDRQENRLVPLESLKAELGV